MTEIYALYPDADAAQRAVDLLVAAGVDRRDVEVIASEPHDERAFFGVDAGTPMPWLAALGGILGGCSGYALASLSQKAYPISTGGMPIVAHWTNGIITYEVTMLGAILVTLATLLVGARLPQWKARLYDPQISDGKILVGVCDSLDALRLEAKKALLAAGAVEVREFPHSV